MGSWTARATRSKSHRAELSLLSWHKPSSGSARVFYDRADTTVPTAIPMSRHIIKYVLLNKVDERLGAKQRRATLKTDSYDINWVIKNSMPSLQIEQTNP